ncbi:MAG TPA: DUF1565 domain-containing protein [Solirubrobacteraceae bacterium]|nr:DUF1565 domain-containing protein [Solirubrobacteraceae bacterium]
MPSRGSISSRGALGAGRARYVIGAVLAVVAFCAMTATALAAKTPHVNIVSQSGPPEGPIPPNTSYYTTIQAAVNATRRNYGDWVLVEPGTYDEEVLVTSAHSGIHIRGMDRNTVILDGKGEAAPGGSNGIEVLKTNNVSIENMTARNYDRPSPDGPEGNAFYWDGGEGSEKEGAHGWVGKYLTAYDTTMNGGYGIFTQNEKEGEWENIYASGYNDSGIYLGACWECKARISKATIEYNAVGYSGSNSGGRLVIEKSTFRHNSAGIVPNGENPGDGPPPQNGMCDAHKPHSPYVKFTSTNIARCTIFKENLITENNDLEVPANPSTEKAPWGVGVELPGDAADLIENNVISKNVNNGVLGFEYPNPFPPEEGCTAELEAKGLCTRTIFFQLTGNKIADNTFEENGTSGAEFASDITLQGGIYPYHSHTSNNNCVSGNTITGGTFPANIEGTWGCQNTTTPPPNNGLAAIGYLVILSEESALRKAVPQAAPPPQETMPKPCEGVPSNPLCP